MDTVTAEKEAALWRFRQIRAAWMLLRCIEACAAVAVLSWSSARLPEAARASGNFLRFAADAILSPSFLFLLGNSIVAVLVARSCRSTPHAAAGDPFFALYKEIWEPAPPPPPPEDLACEEKAVCVEEDDLVAHSGRIDWRPLSPVDTDAAAEEEELDDPPCCGDDEDEFRRTIEAFIASMQLEFRRQETLALVASVGTLKPSQSLMSS